MALRAMAAEDRSTGIHREGLQFGVVGKRCEIDGGEPLGNGGIPRGHFADLLLDLGTRRVAQKTRCRGAHQRPRGVGDRIEHRPDDRHVEGPDPPSRQGVVPFLDTVPAVARRAIALFVFLFRAVAHWRASSESPSERRSVAGLSSCRKGISEVSRCTLLLPGRKVNRTATTKAPNSQTRVLFSQICSKSVGSAIFPPHRLASGVKVEKSTRVPSICM